jgi:hypothetical protein
MIEFLTNYAPDFALFGAIIAAIAPFLRSRYISDKHMINTFSDVKGLASNIHQKEIDFTNALNHVDKLTNKIQNDVADSIINMNKSILAFTQDELYQKMILGLSQLNEINLLLQNKDDQIAMYKKTIKDINKKLEVMENERKL